MDTYNSIKTEIDAVPEYSITYAPARTTLSVDISKAAQSERTINADDNGKTDDKRTITVDDNGKSDDKRTIIVDYIGRKGEARTEELVQLLGSSTTRIKVLLYQLVNDGVLVACGGNRNRTYRLKQD